MPMTDEIPPIAETIDARDIRRSLAMCGPDDVLELDLPPWEVEAVELVCAGEGFRTRTRHYRERLPDVAATFRERVKLQAWRGEKGELDAAADEPEKPRARMAVGLAALAALGIKRE